MVFITTSTIIMATFIDSSVHSQPIINDAPDPDNLTDIRETTYALLDTLHKESVEAYINKTLK